MEENNITVDKAVQTIKGGNFASSSTSEPVKFLESLKRKVECSIRNFTICGKSIS